MNFATRTVLTACVGLALASQAFAAQPVASDGLANGSGMASGDSFNYWGVAYDGSVDKYRDGADGLGGVTGSAEVRVRVGAFADAIIPADDPASDAPFALNIDPHHRIGDEVSEQVFHRNEWILLNEVGSDGVIITRDFDVREPGSLLLLGLGLIGLGLVGRRRIGAFTPRG